jgi:hypothetical protein
MPGPMDLLQAVTLYEVSVAVHVMAAIVGFGPTFAYPIGQKMAEKAFPQHLPFALRLIHQTDKAIVNPTVALVGLTGIFQWIDGPWDISKDQWLAIGFTVYLLIFATALWVFRPSVVEAAATEAEQMTQSLQPGEPLVKSERYKQLMRIPDIAGPVLGILVLVVVYLMEIKPF